MSEIIHAEYLHRLRTTPGFAVLGHEQLHEFRLPGLDFPFRDKYDFLVEGHPPFLVNGLGLGEVIPPVLPQLLQQLDLVCFLVDVKSTTGFAVREVAERDARAADGVELMLYEYDPSVNEYPCGSCPFRSFCPTVPNRVLLARSGPTPEQLVVAEAVLADTAQRLAPVRDTLAAAVAAVGRAQSDGISAAKAWRADAAWDIAKLTEIIAAYGPRGVSAEAAIAERLVCDGHLPAGALADAKRPAQPDQIVLQI